MKLFLDNLTDSTGLPVVGLTPITLQFKFPNGTNAVSPTITEVDNTGIYVTSDIKLNEQAVLLIDTGVASTTSKRYYTYKVIPDLSLDISMYFVTNKLKVKLALKEGNSIAIITASSISIKDDATVIETLTPTPDARYYVTYDGLVDLTPNKNYVLEVTFTYGTLPVVFHQSFSTQSIRI